MKTWTILKDLSNSRLVYSTSIWIFFVPAVLKISGATSDFFSSGEILVPYSFYLIYFSSVAFFIGSTLYVISCPFFVKKISSYSFFIEEGMSIININNALFKVDEEKSKKLIEVLRKEVGSASPEEIDDNKVLTLCSGIGPASFSFNENNLDKVFWIVYDFQQQQRLMAQLLCWFFYSIGFFLIALVFLMNFYSVAIYFF